MGKTNNAETKPDAYMGTWNGGLRRVYVSQLPARKGSKRALRDGVDWGYSYHEPGWRGNDAPLLLTAYWQRRFAADTRRVGGNTHTLDRPAPEAR